MKFKMIALSVASAIALSACGSSNNNSTSTATGILSDSYVKGVTYTTSSNGSGTTGANGEFSYKAGDTVTFKIGSVTLGTVDMASAALSNDSGRLMVRPKDLAGVVDETDEKSLAIGQFIQTAAGALPNDTHIDAGAHAAAFTTADSIDGLDKVNTLVNRAGLTPVSLEHVSNHMLNAPADVKSVEFTPTDVTGLSDANRAISYTSSTVKVTYADNSIKTFPLSYVNLFNNIDTNKTTDHSAVATVRDKTGAIVNSSAPYVPQAPDANSLMEVGGTPYLVTHFEYENSNYGKLPMLMTVAKLDQNSSDGKLTVNGNISQVDFSGVNGLWVPCAGSRSPWNTHLGSEEYEPDARCDTANLDTTFAASSSCTSMEYEARMNAFRVLYGDTTASPYNYGRLPEVTVNIDGSTKVEKWYTLGRIAREKVQFFGDSRTAIQGDDGTYTSLTMFVADKAKDISAGTLYAAKWNQISPAGTDGGSANLTWIKLGHATHTDIKAAVDAGIKFSDLFEVSAVADVAGGFTTIKHGHEVATTEHLKLKSGNYYLPPSGRAVPIATLAAFLETRRYAAIMGATVEFEKYEGVAYNARDNKAYAAMTRMTNGMEDKSADAANDIRLKKNSSGAVYQLTLQSGVTDTDGVTINSHHVPVAMEALVIGQDMTQDAEGNKSVIDNIASPDNLAFSEHMRVLFIGEDTSNHVNNYLWAYHVDTGKLVRILSIPMGAESTGLQVVDNLNGRAYIMSNYQHAGDRNSTAQATFDRILPLINPAKAEVGYLGGLPAMR
ncbi:MAG: alkaline phosphatase PhoX [Gallionella sp.]